MSIRKAVNTDATALSALVSSLTHFYLDSALNKLPDWFLNTLKPSDFLKRIQDDSYLNLVFEQDEEIEGYIAIKNKTHVYHLFVKERSQGHGIARQLWSQAYVLTAHDEKYTLRSSLYAVPIYKRFGFKVMGPEQNKDGIRFQPMVLSQIQQQQ